MIRLPHRCTILVGLLVVLLTGCRKDNFIPISGLIKDPNLAVPVENVKVELWTQQIESGIFTANYVLAGTMMSGADGKFLFNLEKKSFTGIRLIFSKVNYYGWTAELNIDRINNDHRADAEYAMQSKAWMVIHVKNTEPFNSDDYFEFRILNGYSSCEECCRTEKYQFNGTDIDQRVICQTVGSKDISIQWSKRKNGEQTFKTDNFFIIPFDTTQIELIY